MPLCRLHGHRPFSHLQRPIPLRSSAVAAAAQPAATFFTIAVSLSTFDGGGSDGGGEGGGREGGGEEGGGGMGGGGDGQICICICI